MKKTILFLAILILVNLTVLHTGWAQNRKWQCGYQTIRLGERYKSVVEKCGEPDDSYFYRNDLGLRLGTRIKYEEKKLIIVTFQDQFDRSITQRSYETVPVYLYFDRWGVCTKIQEGDRP